MRFELTVPVRGVPPEAALAWWTDFREGPHDHTFLRGAYRRILRHEGDVTVMEDEGKVLGVPLFRERTRARRAGNRVELEGENTVSRFRGAYRFEPAAGGCLVTLLADVELKPALRWSRFAARPLAARFLRMDLEGHAREMKADLVPEPPHARSRWV